MKPRVAPEKRPSVSSATESPSPSPTIAPVTASISRIPGPPAGPSLRITTTSPGLIWPPVTAAIAASSPSNTRAGPRWWRRSWPESFTTLPSGARLPRRMARPPVALSGCSSGRMTSWPGLSCASGAWSPIVLPVTVSWSACSMPSLQQALGEQRRAAGGVQVGGHEPAARLEVAQRGHALGDAVEVVDVQRHAHLAGDRQQVQDAVGRAAAGGATAAMAFSSDSRVMRSLGLRPRWRTSITSSPAA